MGQLELNLNSSWSLYLVGVSGEDAIIHRTALGCRTEQCVAQVVGTVVMTPTNADGTTSRAGLPLSVGVAETGNTSCTWTSSETPSCSGAMAVTPQVGQMLLCSNLKHMSTPASAMMVDDTVSTWPRWPHSI